jgi:hypothetical protein
MGDYFTSYLIWQKYTDEVLLKIVKDELKEMMDLEFGVVSEGGDDFVYSLS